MCALGHIVCIELVIKTYYYREREKTHQNNLHRYANYAKCIIDKYRNELIITNQPMYSMSNPLHK